MYATLNRASSTTPTPSQIGITSDREPIYDGVGPRTSADGSSRLSLSSTMPRPHKKPLPVNGINGSGLTPILKNHGHSPQPSKGSGYGVAHLPPYYAPIQELQDENAPPTPQTTRNKSAPNVLEVNSDDDLLDLNSPNGILNGNKNKGRISENNNGRSDNGVTDSSVTTSGSEQTLMEENMSGYCEPFGKAILGSRGPSSVSHSNSSKDNLLDLVDVSINSNSNEIDDARARLSNAELELEAIVSQINIDNARVTDASMNNNNHDGENTEMNTSADEKVNINNKNYQNAVNHDDVNDNKTHVKPERKNNSVSNENDSTNGNPCLLYTSDAADE